MLRGRRQFAQRGHARVNDRVGCEEIPIVVADITFHLVAGRRRSPEKIRRKHIAHYCHPRTYDMVSPICAAPLCQHYEMVWMTRPHAGVHLCGSLYSGALPPPIECSCMVSMTSGISCCSRNAVRSSATCRLSMLEVQETGMVVGREPAAGACLLLCGNAHNQLGVLSRALASCNPLALCYLPERLLPVRLSLG